MYVQKVMINVPEQFKGQLVQFSGKKKKKTRGKSSGHFCMEIPVL